jgi:hypothetical protein
MPSDSELYREALLLDFLGFNHRCFREINPTTPFDPNWHIEVMGAALEDCRLGRNRRLIINVPPRSLKSLTASVAFPAWLLGQNPSTKIISASYGQDLSDKHARDCRQIMNSQFYRELFPACQLSDRQAVQEYETTAGGFRYSTSVGGPFTGRGSDFIIIDDPLKPDQALSDRERNNANTWFSNTVRTRLDDQRTGVIIIIMQRLHMDDAPVSCHCRGTRSTRHRHHSRSKDVCSASRRSSTPDPSIPRDSKQSQTLDDRLRLFWPIPTGAGAAGWRNGEI